MNKNKWLHQGRDCNLLYRSIPGNFGAHAVYPFTLNWDDIAKVSYTKVKLCTSVYFRKMRVYE